MANEVVVGGRRYWIVSEPYARGWRAKVLEVVDDINGNTRDIGIQVTAETRGAADEIALGHLQRQVRDAG